MKICIIGAGIGGLALAGFCEKVGIDYTILEKEEDFSHHGYSLGLWSNARDMLKKLGLHDKFDRTAIPFRKYRLCTGSGKKIREYSFTDFFQRYGMGYFHLHRKDLIDWLHSNLAQSVRFGTTFSSFQEDDQGVEVTFSDNSKEVFDLLIAADGVNSQIRNTLFGSECRKYENWRSWYLWVDPQYVSAGTVIEYIEPGSIIAAFFEGDRGLVTVNAHQDHTIWDDESGRIRRLRDIFAPYIQLVPMIFEGKRPEEILPTDLSTIRLPSMYQGRIVLLGDAAHGFEPFAGMGASMAMEDAYVLAGELSKKQPVETSLKTYETKRKKRVARARSVTTRMQKFLLIESKTLRRLANFIIPLLPEHLFLAPYRKLFDEVL